jgi:hypothetical protein
VKSKAGTFLAVKRVLSSGTKPNIIAKPAGEFADELVGWFFAYQKSAKKYLALMFNARYLSFVSHVLLQKRLYKLFLRLPLFLDIVK